MLWALLMISKALNWLLFPENVSRTILSSFLFIELCTKNRPPAKTVIQTDGFENVSKQAMIIRLRDLGLMVNFTGHELARPKVTFTIWTGSSPLSYIFIYCTGEKVYF